MSMNATDMLKRESPKKVMRNFSNLKCDMDDYRYDIILRWEYCYLAIASS